MHQADLSNLAEAPKLSAQFGSRAILDSLQAFSEIATSLSGVSEVEEICSRVVGVLKARLGLRSGSIMLLSADGNTLSNVAGTSPKKGGTQQPLRQFKVGEGVAGSVAQDGEAMLISDASADPRFSGGGRVPVRSLLCLPINAGSAGEQRIGVLNLSHSAPGFFNADHQTVFTILATILGKLIAEARLRQELAHFNRELEQQVADRTREIQASHAYLENILSHANDIILSVDWRGRITFVNRRVDTLGYQVAELAGKPFSLLCQHHELPPELVAAMAGSVAQNVELVLTGTGDIVCDTSCSFSPLEDADGGQGALVLIRDVTGTKQLELQMRQMEKLTAIGTLVAGIAHEINNKLVPILVYSELLQRSDLSEGDRKLMATVHKSATGARHIMESLLRFSRQEAPRMAPYPINAVVDEVVEMVQLRGKKQDVVVDVQCAEGLPNAQMDANQIGQVALNLLNNAYDAIGDGGRITVATVQDGERVGLIVSDDGPGIPEAVQARIFDPFFTTKEVGKGTGLGLSLCFGIVQEHQGEIQLESGPDGTRFSVWLPVANADSSTLSEVDVVTPTRYTPGRILICGDDATLMAVVEQVIGTHHQVVNAADGAAVMAALQDNHYDAVLLDQQLEDVGVEPVLDWIQRHDSALAERVLLMCGAGQDALLPAARMIRKPFRMADVLSAVDGVLAAHP